MSETFTKVLKGFTNDIKKAVLLLRKKRNNNQNKAYKNKGFSKPKTKPSTSDLDKITDLKFGRLEEFCEFYTSHGITSIDKETITNFFKSNQEFGAVSINYIYDLIKPSLPRKEYLVKFLGNLPLASFLSGGIRYYLSYINFYRADNLFGHILVPQDSEPEETEDEDLETPPKPTRSPGSGKPTKLRGPVLEVKIGRVSIKKIAYVP